MRIAILCVCVVLLIAAAFIFDLPSKLIDIIESIQDLGIIAALVFILLYILSAVFLIPGSALTLTAGFIFGFVYGTPLVIISATIASTISFIISRYLARDWVMKKISGKASFAAIDAAVAKNGWTIIALLRLSPIVPYNILNYLLGLTSVRLFSYVSASFLCMIPGTAAYVYLGSVANSLTEAASGTNTRTPLEWTLLGVGVVSALAVSIIIARIAKKSLSKEIEPSATE